MPKLNRRPPKKVTTNKNVDLVKDKQSGVKDQWFNYNSEQPLSQEPTRDPRSVGSWIVRRNETDDED